MDKSEGQALAASLGDVLSGVIMSPARVVDPVPRYHKNDLPLRFVFAIPEDWGILHQYNLVGMGYKDNGQQCSWIISLDYVDANEASEDAKLLFFRMKSYEFNTQYRNQELAFFRMDAAPLTNMGVTPLTDLFDVGEPQVHRYADGATLTIECKFKPDTPSAAWQMATNPLRDLLFLVPDPAPYTKQKPSISPDFHIPWSVPESDWRADGSIVHWPIKILLHRR
jgi:hypothetical protein